MVVRKPERKKGEKMRKNQNVTVGIRRYLIAFTSNEGLHSDSEVGSFPSAPAIFHYIWSLKTRQLECFVFLLIQEGCCVEGGSYKKETLFRGQLHLRNVEII